MIAPSPFLRAWFWSLWLFFPFFGALFLSLVPVNDDDEIRITLWTCGASALWGFFGILLVCGQNQGPKILILSVTLLLMAAILWRETGTKNILWALCAMVCALGAGHMGLPLFWAQGAFLPWMLMSSSPLVRRYILLAYGLLCSAFVFFLSRYPLPDMAQVFFWTWPLMNLFVALGSPAWSLHNNIQKKEGLTAALFLVMTLLSLGLGTKASGDGGCYSVCALALMGISFFARFLAMVLAPAGHDKASLSPKPPLRHLLKQKPGQRLGLAVSPLSPLTYLVYLAPSPLQMWLIILVLAFLYVSFYVQGFGQIPGDEAYEALGVWPEAWWYLQGLLGALVLIFPTALRRWTARQKIGSLRGFSRALLVFSLITPGGLFLCFFYNFGLLEGFFPWIFSASYALSAFYLYRGASRLFVAPFSPMGVLLWLWNACAWTLGGLLCL